MIGGLSEIVHTDIVFVAEVKEFHINQYIVAIAISHAVNHMPFVTLLVNPILLLQTGKNSHIPITSCTIDAIVSGISLQCILLLVTKYMTVVAARQVYLLQGL